eukprot:bmy_22714T0
MSNNSLHKYICSSKYDFLRHFLGLSGMSLHCSELIHLSSSSNANNLHTLKSFCVQTRNLSSSQDATSPIMEELLHFHNHTLIVIFRISSLVLYIISLILTTKLTHIRTIDAQPKKSCYPRTPKLKNLNTDRTRPIL